MSAHSFRSVFMVASCAGAALACYLVSLRVASERSQLEDVETRIVLAQRDLRVVQTEIGTRGRLAQLERWNVKVLALSAPAAQQFVANDVELAKLTQAQPKTDFQAPVVMASAPAPRPSTQIGSQVRDDAGVATPDAEPASPRSLIHQASFKIEPRAVMQQQPRAAAPAAAKLKAKVVAAVPSGKPVPAKIKVAMVSLPKAAVKKSVDKPALATAKPVTKPVRVAKNDPLAPLAPLQARPAKKIAKDSGSAR